ncbi:Irc8p [Saccharomyces paradoxus]|uniref:Irc8p n=1 Tax=Saccharomyces paradoxus TaxID=27291 RepID=A0A8B8UU38_SACPA|nr:Irc8 [Saccharomyces paradoxus]QHS74199.1 Irc8 [Saccharomyces paradoxus]
MCQNSVRRGSKTGFLGIKFGSALLSIATGAIAIALLCKFHDPEAVLIVIVCSTLLYGIPSLISFITETVFAPSKFRIGYFYNVLNFALPLITLGCTVDYFHNTLRKPISVQNESHRVYILTLDSLLIFTLFVNGIQLGFFLKDSNANNFGSSSSNISTDQYDKEENSVENGRFVPLKNSSQTLTPDLELLHGGPNSMNGVAWLINELSTSSNTNANKPTASDENSNSSVIRHKLGPITAGKYPKKPSHSHFSKLKKYNSFFLGPIENRYKRNAKQAAKAPKEKKSNHRSSQYVSRLSTISDISKSFLNFLALNEKNGNSTSTARTPSDGRVSIIINEGNNASKYKNPHDSHTIESPNLELEREAIGRINSALLPACLRVTDKIISRQQSTQNEESYQATPLIPQMEGGDDFYVNDILMADELQDIPQVPRIASDTENDFEQEYTEHVDLPARVTLEMWEKDQENILRNVTTNLNKSKLLPPFRFTSESDMNPSTSTELEVELHTQNNFSFPFKSEGLHIAASDQINQQEFKTSDTISELDEYLHDASIQEEDASHLIENSLNQNNLSSTTIDNCQKDMARFSTRHSPTKSIISMISGSGSVKHQHSHSTLSNFFTGHSRNNSQINQLLQGSSNMPSNTSPHSSPTKSLRMRFGKKLSLSNISDTMSPYEGNITDPINYSFGHGHNKNQSIDFSYVRTLQSSHSPTKSTSGNSRRDSLNNDRSHSVVNERALRTASTLFYLQHNNATCTLNGEEPVLEAPQSIRSLSSGSEQESAGSRTGYPEVVFSEYDREKWNVLRNLKQIASETTIGSGPVE